MSSCCSRYEFETRKILHIYITFSQTLNKIKKEKNKKDSFERSSRRFVKVIHWNFVSTQIKKFTKRVLEEWILQILHHDSWYRFMNEVSVFEVWSRPLRTRKVIKAKFSIRLQICQLTMPVTEGIY